MRPKMPRILVTFHSTTDAMAMESYCTLHGIPGRLIPVPGVISAGCGMCWSAPPRSRKDVEEAASQAQLRLDGIYELTI